MWNTEWSLLTGSIQAIEMVVVVNINYAVSHGQLADRIIRIGLEYCI